MMEFSNYVSSLRWDTYCIILLNVDKLIAVYLTLIDRPIPLSYICDNM